MKCVGVYNIREFSNNFATYDALCYTFENVCHERNFNIKQKIKDELLDIEPQWACSIEAYIYVPEIEKNLFFDRTINVEGN